MSLLKVYGGTVSDSNICNTCEHSIRRTVSGQKMYLCARRDKAERLDGPVTQCSDYRAGGYEVAGSAGWRLQMSEGKLRYMTPHDYDWKTYRPGGAVQKRAKRKPVKKGRV